MGELLFYRIHWGWKPAVAELSLHTSIPASLSCLGAAASSRPSLTTDRKIQTASRFHSWDDRDCWWYRKHLQATEGGNLDMDLQLGRQNDMSHADDRSLPLLVKMLLQETTHRSTTHAFTFVSMKCFNSQFPQFCSTTVQISLPCGHGLPCSWWVLDLETISANSADFESYHVTKWTRSFV